MGRRRSMTFGVVCLLWALGSASAALAQMAELEKLADTTPEQRAEFLTQAMTSMLALTPEQVPDVQTLNLKYAKLQQPLLQEHGSTFSRERKIRSLNSEKETSLRGLLSDGQWAAYEAHRSELKQQLEAWANAQPPPSAQ